jgi:hypothetical protein
MKTSPFAALALLVLASCSEPSNRADSGLEGRESPKGVTRSPASAPLPVGAPLAAGVAELRILKVVESEALGGSLRPPSEGAVYVLVEYTILNVSPEQFRFGDAPEPQLVDPDGRTIQADPALTADLRA